MDEYVSRHLEYAGVDQQIFSDGALEEIQRFSGGTPRLLNNVCTHSLLYGYQNAGRIIDDHMVKHVIQRESYHEASTDVHVELQGVWLLVKK